MTFVRVVCEAILRMPAERRQHSIGVEYLDEEWHVGPNHPMAKDHHASSIALLDLDRLAVKSFMRSKAPDWLV